MISGAPDAQQSEHGTAATDPRAAAAEAAAGRHP